MSPKKIIFFVVSGLIVLLIVLWFVYLSNMQSKQDVSGNITVWINDGTTEDFQKMVSAFYDANPSMKNIQITPIKQSSDTDKYRTSLLTTLANGQWPDIFMVPQGEDATMEWYVEPIPSSFINISEFEKKFDLDVFDNLIIKDTATQTQSLKGIPLGYETLGAFYNRAMLRSGTPAGGMASLENLYREYPNGKFPTNLGLSPQYTPNASDIIAFFLVNNDIFSYSEMRNSTQGLRSYHSFGNLPTWTADEEENSLYAQGLSTLHGMETRLNFTTIDAFVRGEISMIIGYPSLASEIEKSYKRNSGNSVDKELIFTDKIPQFTVQSPKNIAKYNYFAISKNSQNKDASLEFIKFLASEKAQEISLQIHPHLIPAQENFYLTANGNIISTVFDRMKIDAFIPSNEKIYVFDYGIKSKFNEILTNKWNTLENTRDTSILTNEIMQSIQCQISTLSGQNNNSFCE